MRDYQRLEELSSTAALGLWADDVVLALDRATRAVSPSYEDKELLNGAAEVVEAARKRSEEPLSAFDSARALSATDSALTVVSALAREQDDQQNGDHDHKSSGERLLTDIAAILRAAADGSLAAADPAQLEPALAFFSMVGELQLAQSNSVLSSGKGARAWMANQEISSFL